MREQSARMTSITLTPIKPACYINMFHFRVRLSKWNRETRGQTLNIVAAVLGARSEHVPPRCEWNTREFHQRGNCPLIRPIIGTLFITGILSSKPPWFHSVHHRSLCIQYHSSNTAHQTSKDVRKPTVTVSIVNVPDPLLLFPSIAPIKLSESLFDW